MSSLAGRFRWRVLGRAVLLVVPVWLVYAFAVQPALGTGAPDPTVSSLVLVVVAVVTIPLQSAGEEYLFRACCFRAVGARFAHPFVAFGGAVAAPAGDAERLGAASDRLRELIGQRRWKTPFGLLSLPMCATATYVPGRAFGGSVRQSPLERRRSQSSERT